METTAVKKAMPVGFWPLAFNPQRSRLTAIMAMVLSLLVLYATLRGLLDTDAIATGVLPKSLLSALHIQDWMSLLLALLSLVFLTHPGSKIFISLLGLVGSFFYGYGLLVITGNFTSIYMVYMGIFGLSIYSLIVGLKTGQSNLIKQIHLPAA